MCWPPSPAPEHGEFPLSPATRRHLGHTEEWAPPRLEEWQKHEQARAILRASRMQSERSTFRPYGDGTPSEIDPRLLKPRTPQPSLLSRLKARAARVSWDSWG